MKLPGACMSEGRSVSADKTPSGAWGVGRGQVEPALSVAQTCFFFSSRRRHTRLQGDWSSDVCSSDLIRELDLVKSVQFLKLSRPDVLAAFHACDVFVLPTRGEVFGIVLAEAMAAEKAEIGRASCRERV